MTNPETIIAEKLNISSQEAQKIIEKAFEGSEIADKSKIFDWLEDRFLPNCVFKDKVLKRGVDVGALSEAQSQKIFDDLPTFKPIPAYICGFANRESSYKNLSYTGKKGKKRLTIKTWKGPINPGDIEKIKQKEGIEGNVLFSGIGDFAHNKGYLFNTGNLLWSCNDWSIVKDSL